ncbi:MAG: 30S ribosomal protein S6--L-glutamate ligase [Planctomycetes bacterium]|nr:30S ribosomal protein S6--L-glutamate ligase [Planctomycetota bacterium]MCB9935099.1 30S ribosomal protein S6--L-glutamate ligase [Planctomycetota bacterium]
MKIAILSQGPRLYSTRRIREAAEARGHKVRVLDPLKFSLDVEKKNPHVWYREKRVENFDAIIPRIGASITFFGTAVVRQYEQMGMFCLNTSSAIATSRDKLRAFQILSRHNIGIPKTAFVRQRASVMPAIERVGGAPVIIKLLEGTQGIGVILADTNKIAEAIVETLQSTRQNVLIQNFVEESRGRDVRAFVVGGRVVAAMRRSAQGTEFRSNVHRGGVAVPVQLEPEYERTAVLAAQILGLRVAGVDMLESNEGPQVMEVNSSPGLEGIEAATGVDIAGEMIKHVEEQVLFPDLDIRQRLTLDRGYGVAEIPIGPESPLVGKTIKESGLRDQDILVLSIMRESQTIPNPRNTREILAGDRLLCYGKLLAMKTLFPAQNWPEPKPRRTNEKAK